MAHLDNRLEFAQAEKNHRKKPKGLTVIHRFDGLVLCVMIASHCVVIICVITVCIICLSELFV